jgi:colanic acid/amylovoran biosynthesis protein
MKNKYIILPSNSDLNRGDQALVWETMAVSKDSGNIGNYYMLKSGEESTVQSEAIGLVPISPILKHPSRKFKSKVNNEYNLSLVIKWGSVAILDFISSILLLSKFTRFLSSPFLPKKVKETMKIINECNACFVKGGGFIHTTGKLTDLYIVYFQLFHVMLAQSLGKPVYVMPNSFGPFKGIGVSGLVRRTLKRCELVSVRESISLGMLKGIGVEGKLFPDLGFSLNKCSTTNKDVENIRDKYPEKRIVAITARPYRFPGSTNPKAMYREYINSLVIFSKWLYKNNYLPVFVEHTLSETTHENDGTAIAEIVSNLAEGEYEIIKNNNYTCRDLKEIYSRFDYVVGTRFHSVIFSMSERTPSIAVEYGGNKGAGIMNDMGLSNLGIPIEDVSSERLIEAFKYLVENKNEVVSKIDQYMNLVKFKRKEMLNFLKESREK